MISSTYTHKFLQIRGDSFKGMINSARFVNQFSQLLICCMGSPLRIIRTDLLQYVTIEDSQKPSSYTVLFGAILKLPSTIIYRRKLAMIKV